MNPLRVEFRPGVRKSLRKIEKKERIKIAAAIELLRFNPIPPNAIRLSGQPEYRIRIGDYRIIYSYNGKELLILVISIGHRREVYRTN